MPATEDRWLDTEELAARLKVSLDTLRDWRYHNYGPAGTRFGRGRGNLVRYRLSEVVRWEKETEHAQAVGGAR